MLMISVVKGRLTDVINLDLNKALDSVPHNPLSKLQMWIWWMNPLENKGLAAWSHHCEAMASCPSEGQWQVAFLRGQYGEHYSLPPLSVMWTAVFRAPSAILSMSPRNVVQLTQWKEGMPPRGILTGLKGGFKPHEVQWGQGQGPAPGLGQS